MGFNEPLVFTPKTNTSDNTSKKQRKLKIIWFNTPFSLSIKTNIGRTFPKSLRQHFPKANRLHKIFNKNTVKLSYSFMSNLSSIISWHNKRLLRPRISEYGCNCRTREDCSLQNQYLTPNLIHQLMLKTMQIKVPKYTLVLQKHFPKDGLQIKTNILL